tara:strand:+ start:102 stop:299 length:198 start_codon:yes stop_codon:yes gene_type:complete
MLVDEKQYLIKLLCKSRALDLKALDDYVSNTPKDHLGYEIVVDRYAEVIANLTSMIDKLMEASDE